MQKKRKEKKRKEKKRKEKKRKEKGKEGKLNLVLKGQNKYMLVYIFT